MTGILYVRGFIACVRETTSPTHLSKRNHARTGSGINDIDQKNERLRQSLRDYCAGRTQNESNNGAIVRDSSASLQNGAVTDALSSWLAQPWGRNSCSA